MNRVLRIFNVGHIGRWDPTRIRDKGDRVVEDAHKGNAGENDGVHYSGRAHETEPPLDEDEDR